MRHLGTFFGFIVLGVIVLCADFYERSRSQETVTSASAYGTDLRERMSWILGETDAQIERANAGGARGGYTPPVPETTSEPMKAAGALAELLGGVVGAPQTPAESYDLGGRMRSFLPEAPSGWERRDFDMSDVERLPDMAGAAEERLGYLHYSSGKILKMTLKGEKNLVKNMRDRTTYMYVQGDKLVQITAINREEVTSDFDADIDFGAGGVSGGDGRDFFGMSQGLVWMKKSRVHWTEKAKDGPDPAMLNARLGDVMLYVKALAPEEELWAFIEGFDIDGLNAALSRPFPNVGSRAPELSDEAARAAHETELEQRRILRDKHYNQAIEAQKREGQKMAALGSMTGVNKQFEGMSRKSFEEMGLPNREELGDYSVMSRKEIIAKSRTLTDAQNGAFGMYFSHVQMKLGLNWDDLKIAVDGNTEDAAKEAKAFKRGTLEADAPTYGIRAEEAKRDLPPGSCLQIASGGYFCGDMAEKLRFLWIKGELKAEQNARERAANEKKRAQKAALKEAERAARAQRSKQAQVIKDDLKANQTVASKPSSRGEVKVNRLPTIRTSRSSGGCGGTQFCRAGN